MSKKKKKNKFDETYGALLALDEPDDLVESVESERQLLQDETQQYKRGALEKRDELINDRIQHDTEDRGWLAQWAVIIVSLWLTMVVAVLINQDKFPLSENVLITLLGTTTLNVLGISYIVLKGLFGAGPEPPSGA